MLLILKPISSDHIESLQGCLWLYGLAGRNGTRSISLVVDETTALRG